MKAESKRELLIGASAGVVFLVVYLAGGNFLVSIICGGAVFLLGSIFIKRPATTMPTQPQPEEEVDYFLIAAEGINTLKDMSKMKAAGEIRDLLLPLIDTAGKIYEESKKKPQSKKVIRNFASYYLPFVNKTVEQYISLVKNNVKSENSDKFKNEVKLFLAKMDTAFQQILEALFKDDMIGLSVEMGTMKSILETEGYLADHSYFTK